MKHHEITKSEKVVLTVIATVLMLALLASITSCSRYVSVQDAANGKARCGMRLR